MACQKLDVEIRDLTQHQEALTRLCVGDQVTTSESAGAPHRLVHNQAGEQIGTVQTTGNLELLSKGTALVRSIRRQEGTVVQVLLRVTAAPPRPPTVTGDCTFGTMRQRMLALACRQGPACTWESARTDYVKPFSVAQHALICRGRPSHMIACLTRMGDPFGCRTARACTFCG